jgi:hypothetical protein
MSGDAPTAPRRIDGVLLRGGIAHQAPRSRRRRHWFRVGRGRPQGEGDVHLPRRPEREPGRVRDGIPPHQRGRGKSQPGVVFLRRRPAAEDGDATDGTGTYEAPTLERSPEVYHVLREMDRTGVDAFLDVHGDEGLPFVFLAGSQGTSVWGRRPECLHGAFLASYERSNPDMQGRVSYVPDRPGGGDAQYLLESDSGTIRLLLGNVGDAVQGMLEQYQWHSAGGGGG